MKITLASCYGFCLGVENALRILRQAKQDNSEKITLLSPIVHNSLIMENIAKDGYFVLDDNRSLAEKINSLDQGTIVFSAHGHDKRLDQLAIDKGLKIIDTTCPRVKANFKSIEKALEKGDDVIFIGITNHPETLASLSLDKNIIFDQRTCIIARSERNTAFSIRCVSGQINTVIVNTYKTTFRQIGIRSAH